ncbi:MAG: SAM-dependent methyltransferase [Sandaracinaceae bacterium]|nr:SAM-dependent methyltransferase [Sandaracinaceae bacterium]
MGQPEDPDKYRGQNLTQRARREVLKQRPPGDIGVRIDRAKNWERQPHPQDVLTKEYSRLKIEPSRLGELVELVSISALKTTRQKTPWPHLRALSLTICKRQGAKKLTLSRLLVATLEPCHGRIHDPCCGSGGMFVQSAAMRQNLRQRRLVKSKFSNDQKSDDLASGQNEARHPRN